MADLNSRLEQQAAIARSQSQSQKAKHYKQPNDTNATIIGYDAATGQNRIQLPDGSITYAQSDTNGAIALGDSVPLHGGTGNIDGLPNYKKQPVVVKKAPLKVFDPVKVLFSVFNEETGNRDFYVGGDRLVRTKILSRKPREDIFSRGRLYNTGLKQSSWIATIYESYLFVDEDEPDDGIFIVTPTETFFHNCSTFKNTYVELPVGSYGRSQRSIVEHGGGYISIIISQPEGVTRDVYYIYKNNIAHRYIEDVYDAIAIPISLLGVKDEFLGALPYVIPSVRFVNFISNEGIFYIALGENAGSFYHLDPLLNRTLLAIQFDVLDSGVMNLVNKVLYRVKNAYRYTQPELYDSMLIDGVDIKNSTTEIEIDRYKLGDDNSAPTDTIKVKVLSLKCENAVIHSVSYWPPK